MKVDIHPLHDAHQCPTKLPRKQWFTALLLPLLARTPANAMQRLRANSMDAAAAANKSIITSATSEAAEGEDPATRGRINRDKERAKRDAKRKAATAAARAALGGPDYTGRAKA